MRKVRTNIKDVANRAGVHPSTVSRVLNPATRAMVSDSLAEKIIRIADELGYRRNPLASGLRTQTCTCDFFINPVGVGTACISFITPTVFYGLGSRNSMLKVF